MISPQPKPPKRAAIKRKRRATKAAHVKSVRAQVFEREEGWCRVCRALDSNAVERGWAGIASVRDRLIQPATDLHEIRFRSLGGKVSTQNSIAVCRSHHRDLQAHRISIVGSMAKNGWMLEEADANGPLTFQITEQR